jgi:hypothetical protein
LRTAPVTLDAEFFLRQLVNKLCTTSQRSFLDRKK